MRFADARKLRGMLNTDEEWEILWEELDHLEV